MDNPVCPDSWHVPSDAEWKEMEMYLGMTSSDADLNNAWRNTGSVGTQLKTSTWGGTNTSGFTALPGGHRSVYVTFGDIGAYGNWWSSTSQNSSDAFYRDLYSSNVGVYRNGSRKSLAIRFAVFRIKNQSS